MAAQIESRRAPAVEQRDLRRVANAEQALLQRDGVVDAQPRVSLPRSTGSVNS